MANYFDLAKKTLFLSFSVFLFGAGCFLSTPCFAQGEIALSIAPLTFELTANPGDELSSVLKVFNNGDFPVSITVNAEDFTAAGEMGEVALLGDEEKTYSLAKWVSVSPETFVLEPDSLQIVEFTVSVPLDGEPGGHYASILVSTGGGSIPGGGAAIAQKIGSLLLLQVSGEVREQLSINSFNAPSFSEYGPTTLSARFENTGTVHLKPRGFIRVTNMFGKESANLQLPQKNILPDSVRRIDTTWDQYWLFGKYTATLTAIYGSTNEPISFVTTFWVIPWKISLAVLLALIIIIIFFYKTRRRWGAAVRILVKGEK